MSRFMLAFLCICALALAGCGAAVSYEVTATVLSEPGTQDLHVWAPEDAGPWPVIFAIPGSGGEAEGDLGVLGPELASHGFVVMATDWKPRRDLDIATAHAECGYRFARTMAAEHGGDLTQPVTMLGFSFGGPIAVYVGVDDKQFDAAWEPAYYGASGACFPGASIDRPDVIVSIAGPFVDVGFPWGIQQWGNNDALVTLIAGADDEGASTSQSEAALTYLGQNDYEATVVEVPDADHGSVVFHDLDNDGAELPPTNEIGQEVVRIILDAIEQAQP